MSRTVILQDLVFTKEEYNTCLNYISRERRDLLSKFHRSMDQYRGLASSLLTRCIINESTGIDNRDIIIEKSDYGKPYCNAAMDIKFNLSHSGNCVVGVFDKNQVGIDVEVIGDKDNDDIVKRFFSKHEQDYYTTCEDKSRKFYKLWTIKEAYIKYLGLGMSKGFHTFYSYWDNGQIRIRDDELQKDLSAHIECIDMQNYYLTVISETKTEFETWTVKDLLDKVSKLNVVEQP